MNTETTETTRRPVRKQLAACERLTGTPHDQAVELHALGFLPYKATDVRRGDEIAYWRTDVFRLAGCGHFDRSTVVKSEPYTEDGEDDPWGVLIVHDTGYGYEMATVDENEPVWIRVKDGGR